MDRRLTVAMDYLKKYSGDIIQAVRAADMCGDWVDAAIWHEAKQQHDSEQRQIITWYIGVESPIVPTDPLPEMPEIPSGSILILSGRAPIWRYAMALHRAHGSAAGAIACFDPRLGNVIVASHVPDLHEGQVL